MRASKRLVQASSLLAAVLLIAGCSSDGGGGAVTPTSPSTGGASPVAPVAASPSAGAATGPSAAPSTLPSSSPAVAASPASNSAAAAAPPEQAQVNIVYATSSGANELLSIAQQQGYFQRYGLSVTLAYAESELSIAALLSGEANLAVAEGVSTVQAEASGASVKIIADWNHTNPYVILSAPDYANPDDLRGKTIAISTTGSTTDVSARIGLSAIGLQMGQDITPIQIGNSPARFVALSTGQVAAAIDDAEVYLDRAQAAGMHVLVNLQAQHIPYDASALVVRTDWAQSHPNTVAALLKALTDGSVYYADPKNKEESLAVIGKDLALPPTDSQVQQVYDSYYTRFPADPYPIDAGIDTILTAMRGISPGVYDNVTTADVIDPSYVQSLRNQGYQPSQ